MHTTTSRRSRFVIAVLVTALLLASLYTVGAQRGNNPDVTGPLPTGNVGQAPETTLGAGMRALKQERFDAELKGWQRIDKTLAPDQVGRWQTESGTLAQAQTAGAGTSFDEVLLLAPEQVTGRADIAVQVYPQGNQVVGLVFGSSPEGYYIFRVFRDGTGLELRRMLQRYDAATGLYSTLAEDKTGKGYEVGRWQELRVELQGQRVRAFFDGAQVFDLADVRLGNGQAGVYTLALGEVLFDNFTVSQP